jgi:hypothetical protein
MNLEELTQKAKETTSKFEAFKSKTGVAVELIENSDSLPVEEIEAENEIATRVATQIGNAKSSQDEAQKLIPQSSTPEQKKELKGIFARLLDKAFDPMFLALQEKTGIDAKEVKKLIDRGVDRVKLMVSNAKSDEKKKEFEGDTFGRYMDILFPKKKDKSFIAGLFVAFQENAQQLRENAPAFKTWVIEKLNPLIGEKRTEKLIGLTEELLKKDKVSLALFGAGAGMMAANTLPVLLALPIATVAYLLPMSIISEATINRGVVWKDKHKIKPDCDPYKLLEEEPVMGG